MSYIPNWFIIQLRIILETADIDQDNHFACKEYAVLHHIPFRMITSSPIMCVVFLYLWDPMVCASYRLHPLHRSSLDSSRFIAPLMVLPLHPFDIGVLASLMTLSPIWQHL
jgi:hypothetical protein